MSQESLPQMSAAEYAELVLELLRAKIAERQADLRMVEAQRVEINIHFTKPQP